VGAANRIEAQVPEICQPGWLVKQWGNEQEADAQVTLYCFLYIDEQAGGGGSSM
jgi:hypothetical protein